MEKRILLAFFLSFLFIMVWSRLNPTPNAHRPGAPAQSTNAETAKPLSALPKSETPSIVDEKTTISLPEKIVSLENEKLRVEFSNIGGTIKSIVIKQYDATLPVTSIGSIAGFENKEFTVERKELNEVVFVRRENGADIKKKFTLVQNEYLIKQEVEMSSLDIVDSFILDINRLDNDVVQSAVRSLLEYSINKKDIFFRKSGEVVFTSKDNRKENTETTWSGFRDKYFCFINKPEISATGYTIEQVDGKKLKISLLGNKQPIYKSTIYFGPQDLKLLRKYNLGLENMMVFSNWGILDFFAKIIYFLLEFIHKLIPVWGIAVILVGILINLLTYPLTLASFSSMKKMQSLQPEMTKIREQYKNNPQKMNQEMMALYKEHRVNPMGGCLPMIIQMPVFIGTYQVLWRSVFLKGQKFLWINDLSLPDRAYVFPAGVGILGVNEINILPVLMAILIVGQQFYQMKNMKTTDPAQLSQQKMMAYLMPVMMFVFFYKAASALTLYFTIVYIFTTFTQWKMSKLA